MPVATSIGGQRKHCIVNCQILWLPCSAEDPITTTTTYSCLQLWSHIGIHLVKTPHWQKCTWYSPLGSGLQVLKQIGTTLIPGFATVHIPRYVTPSRAATTKLSQLPPSTMPLSPTQPSKPPPDTFKNLFSPPGLWGLSIDISSNLYVVASKDSIQVGSAKGLNWAQLNQTWYLTVVFSWRLGFILSGYF